jgi:uncharacterized phage-associated protein
MAKFSADQVADTFLAFCNEYGDWLTNLKLQKMLYYAQGWHLGQHGEPLFDEPLQAWIHGPVVPDVYRRFKSFGHLPIDSPAVLADQPDDLVAHVRDVWEAYGELTAYDLERISHSETPWRNARGALAEYEACNNPLSVEEMKHFFAAKLANG